MDYFEQFALIYFPIELNIFRLEFSIIDQNILNAADILETLPHTQLEKKQQKKVTELRFKYLNLSGKKQEAIELLDNLVLPKLKRKSYPRIKNILKKADILVKLNRINEAYETLKQEGILEDKNSLPPFLQCDLKSLYCRISILTNQQKLAKRYLETLSDRPQLLSGQYYNLIIMYDNKFKDNLFNIKEVANELINCPYYYLLDKFYHYLLMLGHKESARMFLDKILQDMPHSRRAREWQLKDQCQKQEIEQALETSNQLKKCVGTPSINIDGDAHAKANKLNPEIQNELERSLAIMQQHDLCKKSVEELPRSSTLIQQSFFTPREPHYLIPEKLATHRALTQLHFLKDNKIPFYFVGSCLFAILDPQHEASTNDIEVVVPFYNELDLAKAGFHKSKNINGLYTQRIFPINERLCRPYSIDLFMPANSDGVHDFIEHDYHHRDFTISCLYGKPSDTNNHYLEIIDPTGQGISDFKNKILRMVAHDATHLEADPVRALRAIKWISRGYKPTDSLVAALKTCSLNHADANQVQHFYAYASKLLKKDTARFIKLVNEYCPQYVETLTHQEHTMPLLMTYG